jgi:hypothetical protein
VQLITGAAGIPGGSIPLVKSQGVILPVGRGSMKPDHPTLAGTDWVKSYCQKSNESKSTAEIKLHTLTPFCSFWYFHYLFILNPDLVVDLGPLDFGVKLGVLDLGVKLGSLDFGVKLGVLDLGVKLGSLDFGVKLGVLDLGVKLGVDLCTFGVNFGTFVTGVILVIDFRTSGFGIALLTIDSCIFCCPLLNPISPGFLVSLVDIILLPVTPGLLTEVGLKRFSGVTFADLA